MSLLEVRGLGVTVGRPETGFAAVRGVDLDVERGQCVALVGESGSGKTLTASAVAGLLPAGLRAHGEVRLEGRELLGLSARERRTVAGREIGFVFQEPMTALHPIFTVGRQFDEALRAHGVGDRRTRQERTEELLTEVGLPPELGVARQRVDQLSGGMRQRVMIALAICLGPALLVADEPTTALDVSTQKQVLDLFGALRREHDLGLLLITHDFGVVAENADVVGVMYAGQLVERGTVHDVMTRPQHAYTRALLECIPRVADRRDRLPTVGQLAPGLTDDRVPGVRHATGTLQEVGHEHYVRVA